MRGWALAQYVLGPVFSPQYMKEKRKEGKERGQEKKSKGRKKKSNHEEMLIQTQTKGHSAK